MGNEGLLVGSRSRPVWFAQLGEPDDLSLRHGPVVMNRPPIGRYVYAVGGIRKPPVVGVPVQWVLVFVYALCGLLAGLGDVMGILRYGDPKSEIWSNCRSLRPLSWGTSLAGGGDIRHLGRALIIGVIRNGMNLTGVGHICKAWFTAWYPNCSYGRPTQGRLKYLVWRSWSGWKIKSA